MATSIAVSEETQYLLHRYKESSGLRSLDEAVADLFGAGNRTIERLMARRRREVERASKKAGIVRLVAFGSRVWGAAHDRSDVDLVAEFRSQPSLFDLMAAQEALAKAFGVPVDLHTWAGLRDRVRKRIERDGVTVLG
jgi:predicted nucleotidyltransferase